MALANALPVKNFFSRLFVRFLIHVLLMTGLILIAQRYWSNYKQKQEINQILNQNKSIATSNSILKLQKDYFQSSFYAEKAAKESQWKNLGETVVDTKNLESKSEEGQIGTQAQNYIPKPTNEESSNPEKWLKYIFSQDGKNQ